MGPKQTCPAQTSPEQMAPGQTNLKEMGSGKIGLAKLNASKNEFLQHLKFARPILSRNKCAGVNRLNYRR